MSEPESLRDCRAFVSAEAAMRIFVVGASGRTGRRLVERALERGYAVTALVRNANSLAPAEGLNAVHGDARNSRDLELAIPGHDVVVSVLGRRSKADATLLQDSARAMLAALRSTGVSRYIVVSQGLLFPSWNPIIVLLRFVLASAVADSTAMERLVQASQAQWTIVRPPRLKDGHDAGAYHAYAGARPKGSLAMDRGDLATFLLDEAEHAKFGRAVVGVG